MSKPKKLGKPVKIFLIIYISFLAIMGIVAIFLACISPEARFFFQSEQQAQVQVVEKNINRHTTSGGEAQVFSLSFLIAFRFNSLMTRS